MFIKSLIISAKSKIIREINFHNGINLIVDETPYVDGKETGNNVGKTTVLRLIDFCLGGEAKQIYTDPETKRDEYKLVKEFLVDNEVLITLILKENLDVEKSTELKIEKNFLPRNRKIQRIDNLDKTDDEFDEALTNFLFPGHYGKKPTFRQIISHNLRINDYSINNTLKTLDYYTRNDEYETLYLFLFGCNFEQGDTKQELLTKIRIEQKFKDRLEKEQTKSAYETALSILENEIEELNYQKSRLNLNENFESDLDELNKKRYQINRLSSIIGKLNIRRDLIIEAREDLSKNVSTIDLRQLRQIYEQATSQVAGIQKTFEELTRFHNQMINEKISYIVKDLPSLELEIELKRVQLESLLLDEKSITSKISLSTSFNDLEKLIAEINEKYRRKGEYESIINQMNVVEKNLENFNEQLKMIDDALFSHVFEQKVKDQVNKFSKKFASISNLLYGEQYALKVDIIFDKKSRRLYKFSAFNTNFSSGKKQGEVSCFDIAYTLFADDENIPCLHFLLNDKKELMHDNQLLKIAELVNKNQIQFVASILQDKLPNDLNHENFFVIKLSQIDKLFRIESY